MIDYHVHIYRANHPVEKVTDAGVGEVLEEYLTKYKIEEAELRFRSHIKTSDLATQEAPYASLIVTLHPDLGNTIFTFIGCYCDGEFDKKEEPPF